MTRLQLTGKDLAEAIGQWALKRSPGAEEASITGSFALMVIVNSRDVVATVEITQPAQPPTTLLEVLTLNREAVAQAPGGVRAVYEMNRDYHARLAAVTQPAPAPPEE